MAIQTLSQVKQMRAIWTCYCISAMLYLAEVKNKKEMESYFYLIE